MPIRQVGRVADREDGTAVIVGQDGDPFAQSDGDFVVTNVPADQRDFDIVSDLVAEGPVTLGPVDIGGAQAVAGGVQSTDGNPLEITLDWLGEGGQVLFSRSFGGGSDSRVLLLDVAVFSDLVEITVSDTSGNAQNNVTGTFNIS
jgi:hypothetical protein